MNTDQEAIRAVIAEIDRQHAAFCAEMEPLLSGPDGAKIEQILRDIHRYAWGEVGAMTENVLAWHIVYLLRRLLTHSP